jgi:hypothetical protein
MQLETPLARNAISTTVVLKERVSIRRSTPGITRLNNTKLEMHKQGLCEVKGES